MWKCERLAEFIHVDRQKRWNRCVLIAFLLKKQKTPNPINFRINVSQTIRTARPEYMQWAAKDGTHPRNCSRAE
jgi:hypothetical protein